MEKAGSEFQYYQNSIYTNKRGKKQTLIIDVLDNATNTSLGSGSTFKVFLFEPLIIDSKSELYLDNLVTFNSSTSSSSDSVAFCLTIEEFSVNTNIASNISDGNTINTPTYGNKLYRKIIIPNDNRSSDNFNTFAVTHKSKKFNYLCDLNPMRITSLTCKITDMNDNPIFHSNQFTDNYYTYHLKNITTPWIDSGGVLVADGDTADIPIGTRFTFTNTVDTLNCITVAPFKRNDSSLYFAVDSDPADISSFTNNANTSITFTNANLLNADPVSTNSNSSDLVIGTPYISLIRYGARFTAEMTIINK